MHSNYKLCLGENYSPLIVYNSINDKCLRYIPYCYINPPEGENMEYKCQKCGTEFDVKYQVVCPQCKAHDWDCAPLWKLRKEHKEDDAVAQSHGEIPVTVTGDSTKE